MLRLVRVKKRRKAHESETKWFYARGALFQDGFFRTCEDLKYLQTGVSHPSPDHSTHRFLSAAATSFSVKRSSELLRRHSHSFKFKKSNLPPQDLPVSSLDCLMITNDHKAVDLLFQPCLRFWLSMTVLTAWFQMLPKRKDPKLPYIQMPQRINYGPEIFMDNVELGKTQILRTYQMIFSRMHRESPEKRENAQ